MADLSGLIAALSGKQKEVYGENPWLNAGAATEKPPISAKASFAKNMLGALMQGAASGAMTGYGKYQAANELNDARDELFGFYNPRDINGTVNAAQNSRAWAPYADSLMIDSLNQLADDRDRELQFQYQRRIQSRLRLPEQCLPNSCNIGIFWKAQGLDFIERSQDILKPRNRLLCVGLPLEDIQLNAVWSLVKNPVSFGNLVKPQ